MTKQSLSLFGLGIFLASIPSLLSSGFHLAATLCLLLGGISLVAAAAKDGWRSSQSLLLLLVTSNIAFWLCYALWHLKSKIAGPSPMQGIDAYAGILSVWFLLLLLLSVYEGCVFLWDAFSNPQRGYALLGFAGLLIQGATSIRLAYSLIQGV
jgi:hypothetical protein